MANPHKGEVEFEAAGKHYVFRFGTFAQMQFERRTKKPISAYVNRPDGEWSVEDVVAMFWAGLCQRHKLGDEEVAELIDDLGTDRVVEIMSQAFGLAKPADEAKGEGADGDARPPQAAASATGTG